MRLWIYQLEFISALIFGHHLAIALYWALWNIGFLSRGLCDMHYLGCGDYVEDIPAKTKQKYFVW